MSADIVDDLLNLHAPGHTNYTCLKAADEINQLRQDLAAARADAERYRWLRGDVQDDFSTRWSRWRIEHWASPGPTWSDIRGADLDAAIDAAIAGEKK